LKCVIWSLSFVKKILIGSPIRIERVIHEFSYVENSVKRRKYPVRINAYIFSSCEQYK
jgi:hypothetical protein